MLINNNRFMRRYGPTNKADGIHFYVTQNIDVSEEIGVTARTVGSVGGRTDSYKQFCLSYVYFYTSAPLV